ncbi:MAG: ferrous iron transport protein A [Ilumatobacter sp.]|nr:ferrous iron transport protein A [Ilumatobacter sp.]
MGAVVTVVEVLAGPHGQGRRLEDLGIVAGTEILVERRAPLGDPTVYEVRRARLAVRRGDAQFVRVAVGDENTGPYVAL